LDVEPTAVADGSAANLPKKPAGDASEIDSAATRRAMDRGPSIHSSSSSSGCSGMVAGQRGDADTRGNLRRGEGVDPDPPPPEAVEAAAGILEVISARSVGSRDTDDVMAPTGV